MFYLRPLEESGLSSERLRFRNLLNAVTSLTNKG